MAGAGARGRADPARLLPGDPRVDQRARRQQPGLASSGDRRFALACCCLYAFVARRSSNLYGLLAALVLVSSTASSYAVEARPYALVLGFASLALVAWQRAMEEGPRRKVVLVVLGASLAAAVASHYYAVLLLVPFGAALAVRSATKSRIDWAATAAVAAGLTPIVIFAPLLLSAHGYAATFWAAPRWWQPFRFYLSATEPVLTLPFVTRETVVVALVAGAVGLWSLRRWERPTKPAPRPPDHEVVLVVFLALLPFVAIVVAKLVTGAYVNRYVISAVLALAVAAALALHRLDRRLVIAGPLAAGVLVAAAVFSSMASIADADDFADERSTTAAFLQEESDGTPVVIASSHEFLELSHDASQHGGTELRYLADPEAALRWLGTDTIELGLVQLQDFAPLQMVDYGRFVATHDRFLLYGEQLDWDWVTDQLRVDGYRFEVLARLGSEPLYEVFRPTAREAAAG